MRMTVMCGGRGTRLGQPIKCLTEIAGRPFLDWKLSQLAGQGFTEITLAVGPYRDAYETRYGDLVEYIEDDQEGVLPVAQRLPQPSWWCNGDTLLARPKAVSRGRLRTDKWPNLGNPTEGYGPPPSSIGVCTTYLVEPANVPGGFLDAGYYYGLPPFEWRVVEMRPYHINTPESFAECERYLQKTRRFHK